MNQKKTKELREKLIAGNSKVGGFQIPRKVKGERTQISRVKTPKPERKVLSTDAGKNQKTQHTQGKVELRPEFIPEPGMPGFHSFGY